MKFYKIFVIILIILFFSINSYALQYTCHNEGSEDIRKNPAVIAFSKSSFLFAGNYRAYFHYDREIEFVDSSYDTAYDYSDEELQEIDELLCSNDLVNYDIDKKLRHLHLEQSLPRRDP